MNILIVDDNTSVRQSIAEILRIEGHEVIEAVNGLQALDSARTYLPDLIISDIMMPDQDGFSFCNSIKTDEVLMHIPVILLSGTFTDEEDQVLARAVGAARFVIKPVTPATLVQIISEVMEGRREDKDTRHDEMLNKSRVLESNPAARLANKLNKKVLELEKEREALRQSQNQLHELGLRLREIEESERKRISRELHDRCGQNLTALSINLNIIQNQLGDGVDPDVNARLRECLCLVEEVAGEVRNVMDNLRPDVLDDYGLVSAIRWYCERYQKTTGIKIAVEADKADLRLPEKAETQLFRICQEALTNVAKHADTGNVRVSIRHADHSVVMIIEDDGRGFMIKGHDGHARSGWGLVTMKERAESLGGSLHIESSPGKGTKVTTEISIDKQK